MQAIEVTPLACGGGHNHRMRISMSGNCFLKVGFYASFDWF
jgi:hypothetical protein